MTLGLEGAFSRMQLQPAQGQSGGAQVLQPAKGQSATVRYMSPAEQQDLSKKVNNLIDAREKSAVSRQNLAVAKAKEAEAAAKLTESKADLAKLNAQAIQGLEMMAANLQKMQGAFKGNADAVAKIEVLRQKILNYKDNLPNDAALRSAKMQELKQESIALVQSLQKK